MYEKPKSNLENIPVELEDLLNQQRKYVSLVVVIVFPLVFLFLLLFREMPTFTVFLPGFVAGAIVKFTGKMVESEVRKIHGAIFGTLITVAYVFTSAEIGLIHLLSLVSNGFLYFMVSERNLTNEQEKMMLEYEKNCKATRIDKGNE